MKKNLWTALLSLAIAFSLWLYVVTVVNPEFEDTYYNIPVVLDGEGLLEERGLMITSNEDPSVSLQLKGNRSYLVDLKNSDITILADVSRLSRAGTYHVSYEEIFPGDIPDNAIEVQTRTPGSITLVVEERITKAVEVVVDYGRTNVPVGFICDKEAINFGDTGSTVTVTGPKSVIDRISQAVIDINLTDRRESIIDESFVFTLCDENGDPVDAQLVRTNVPSVDVTLRIQRYKDITLEVEVIDGGGATRDTSSIEIEPKVIRISGNETMLDKIEDTLIIGTIDLSKYLVDTKLTFDIPLPENVTNESNLEEAVVQVKFPALRTKNINVSEIKAINVPEGLEVDMITMKLEIKVRGPIALVERLRASDLDVTVDFANSEMGTATMPVEITVDSKFAGVGVVGTYQVSATLREPLEEVAE